MKCEYHNGLEANYICSSCGVSICKDCAVNHNGKIVCIECAQKNGLPIIKNISYEGSESNHNPNASNPKASTTNYYNGKPTRRYSTFWSTVFSFIPGGGHMYLGAMKRGLQFMLAFFGIIALTNFFYLADFLIFFSVVIWFYSFFDCYHTRKKLERGEQVDEELILPIDIKTIDARHLGIGLVFLGGLILLNEFFDQLVYLTNRMNIDSESVRITIRLLRDSIFPLVLIVIGFFILKKSKKSIDE